MTPSSGRSAMWWFESIAYWRLDAVLGWLEYANYDPRWWKIKMHLIELCLSEMNSIVEAKANVLSIGQMIDDPVLRIVDRAIPLLKAMLAGMHSQDRTAALKQGRAAAEVLMGRKAVIWQDGAIAPRPSSDVLGAFAAGVVASHGLS